MAFVIAMTWRLDVLLEALTPGRLLTVGWTVLLVTVLVAVRTKWGQQRPLRTCIVLSLMAHLMLAAAAATVPLVRAWGKAAKEPMVISGISMTNGRSEPTSSDSPDSVGAEDSSSNSKQPAELPPWDDSIPWQDPPGLSEPPLGSDANQSESLAPSDPERLLLSLGMSVRSPTPTPGPTLPAEVRPQAVQVARQLQHPPARLAQTLGQADTLAELAEKGPELDRSAATRPRELERDDFLQSREFSRIGLQKEADAGPLSGMLAQAGPANSIRQETLLPVGDQEALEEVPVTQNEASLSRLAEAAVPLTRMALSETLATSADEARASPPVDQLANFPAGGRSQRTDPQARPETPVANINGDPAAEKVASGLTPLLPRRSENHPDGDVTQPPPQPQSLQPAKKLYRLRFSDRPEALDSYGGDAQTEQAVTAALDYLARTQSADGRWDADRQQAGREHQVAGHHRRFAGRQADTGVTGLALLAFLGAGHSHQEGEHKHVVHRGLRYLLGAQHPSGHLAGSANVYAAAYCHPIATFALAEAAAVSQDTRLHQPLRRALRYSLRLQDPHSGGWRYTLGEPGDASVLGWHVMAFRSAELAGVPFPQATRARIEKFLRSISTGDHGGLGKYRPQAPASRAMTAEAWLCLQALSLKISSQARAEAADSLLAEIPGHGAKDFYYWYYATLALRHEGGPVWDRWNVALKRTLLAGQQKKGPFAGSWSPDSRWGGYGGRVYTTALGALSLEAYYRYSSAQADPPKISTRQTLQTPQR